MSKRLKAKPGDLVKAVIDIPSLTSNREIAANTIGLVIDRWCSYRGNLAQMQTTIGSGGEKDFEELVWHEPLVLFHGQRVPTQCYVQELVVI
jgi:hypothetical protein